MGITVSVIIPVYNVEDYLEQCLDTVVKQTLQDMEIIIVDDGSSDSSLNICERYACIYENVILIKHPHWGVSKARNAGISAARGEYVAFVDSDDFIDINMFKTLYETAVSNNLDVVSCKFTMISESHDIESEYLSPGKIAGKVLNKAEGIYHFFCTHQMTVLPWDKLYKRTILVDNHVLFPENASAAVDANFSLEVYLSSDRLMLLDKFLYFWRTGRADRITKSTDPKKIRDIFNEYHKLALAGYSLDESLLPKAYKNYFVEDCSVGILDKDHYYFYQKDIFHYYVQVSKRPIVLYGMAEDNERFLENFKFLQCEVKLFDEEKDDLQDLQKAVSDGAGIWITNRDEFFRRLCRLRVLGIINEVADILPFAGKTELESVYLEGYKGFYNDFALNYFAYDFRQTGLKLLEGLRVAKILEMFDVYIQAGLSSPDFNEEQKNDFKASMRRSLGEVYLKYQERNFLTANLLGKIDYQANTAFFGASSLGVKYLHMANMRFENLIFVDNDIKKDGSYLLKYQILCPENFKTRAKDYKIYVTSMYFGDIAVQLLSMGVIKNLSEIMVFDGQLENEALFCEVFHKLVDQQIF